jgi:pyridoxamine 5'-phosphate oxidase
MALTPLSGTKVPASGDLGAIVADVWARIAGGLDGRWPPWALPMLVTTSKAGPRARVLALRTALAAERQLVFHCDARSDKVREIEADARVSVVFWDPADGIEARFTARAVVHRQEDVTNAAWQDVSRLRRLASRTAKPPGAKLGAPARLDELPQATYTDGYENFAVIHVEVAQLDWLWVGADDLRRALFTWNGTRWSGAWTVP